MNILVSMLFSLLLVAQGNACRIGNTNILAITKSRWMRTSTALGLTTADFKNGMTFEIGILLLL
jgi:hypothetical protein